MHGAVTVGDYMVIIGGIGASGSAVVQLSVYEFACNQWTDVTDLTLADGKLLHSLTFSLCVWDFTS